MKEKLEAKRSEIKAKFDQTTSQINSLQEEIKKLQGAYSVLGELIDEIEESDKKEK